MDNFVKYSTLAVALFGAFTGGFAAYSNYAASEFKKPIDLRTATSNSYNTQIDSAFKRGDEEEVLRVSLDLERYEEAWRNNLKLVSLTSPVTNLVSLNLKPENTAQIVEILKYSDTYVATGSVEPLTIGSAYLATGDYNNADKFFKIAAIKNPKDVSLYALRVLALQGKAKLTAPGSEKDAFLKALEALTTEASIKGVDKLQLQTLSTELSLRN